MTRTRSIVLASICALLATTVVAAGADETGERSTITTVAATYATPVLAIAEGDGLDLDNQDILPHDVTATEDGPDGKPLFASLTIPGGTTTPVDRVETLEPGAYQFFCTLHPWMHGVLTVNEAGVRVPPSTSEPPPAPEPPADSVALPAGVVTTPTSLTAHGDSMYVASYAQGTVFELSILAGGVLGAPTPYVTGVTNPLGVAFDGDGTLYVADSHPSARSDRTTAGRVWAFPDGGGDAAAVGVVVIDELPNGRHNTNGMAVHGDRLYVTNGNSTDDGLAGGEPEELLSGTLVSVPLSAVGGPTIVVPPNGVPAGMTVEAAGMRNVYDVAFRPGTDEAWMPTNGPDAVDPYGEDTLVKVDDVAGPAPDFGFPGCLYDADWALHPAPPVGPCLAHTPPEQLLGLHVSADGLAFGPADGFWAGDLFIAEFGNFFGDEIVGHRVVRVPIDAAGKAGPPEDFVLGPAPLDLTFGPAGLYVADFGTGQITLYAAP